MEQNKSLILLVVVAALAAMSIDKSTAMSPPPPPHSHSPAPAAPPHPNPPPHVACSGELGPCKNGSTSKPSSPCCHSLKHVYDTEMDCLCTILDSPDLSRQLGLNTTFISSLLESCNITNGSTALCNSAPGSAPSFSPGPMGPAPNEAVTAEGMSALSGFASFLCFLMFVNDFYVII